MIKLDRPLLPFLPLFLSPLVTVPIIAGIVASLPDCGIDEPWWQLQHIQLAFLPALLDLAPFLWVASSQSQVRRAGLVAGVLGMTRAALPQVLVAVYAANWGGHGGDPDCSVSSFLLPFLATVMLGLWLGSVLVAAFYLRRTARPDVPA